MQSLCQLQQTQFSTLCVYKKLNAHFRSCHGYSLVRFLVKFVHVYMVYVFTVAFEAANVNMGEEQLPVFDVLMIIEMEQEGKDH